MRTLHDNLPKVVLTLHVYQAVTNFFILTYLHLLFIVMSSLSSNSFFAFLSFSLLFSPILSFLFFAFLSLTGGWTHTKEHGGNISAVS